MYLHAHTTFIVSRAFLLSLSPRVLFVFFFLSFFFLFIFLILFIQFWFSSSFLAAPIIIFYFCFSSVNRVISFNCSYKIKQKMQQQQRLKQQQQQQALMQQSLYHPGLLAPQVFLFRWPLFCVNFSREIMVLDFIVEVMDFFSVFFVTLLRFRE